MISNEIYTPQYKYLNDLSENYIITINSDYDNKLNNTINKFSNINKELKENNDKINEINEKLRIYKTLKIRNNEYLKNLKYDLKVCKNNIKNLLTIDNI